MNTSDIIKKYSVTEGLQNETNKNIIFIDCMDSVIYRDFSLDVLLSKWSKKMESSWGIRGDFLHYYRRQIVAGPMHNMVHINTIYNEIADQCIFYKLLAKEKRNVFVYDCHKKELDIEIKSQHLIKKCEAFLIEQKQKGRKIYCLSDFRLPSDDIKMFFESQNVLRYFVDVFSSSEFGATKKEGSLYPIIMKKLGVNPQECIMLGDNLKSDCINSSKCGIKSYWLNNIK